MLTRSSEMISNHMRNTDIDLLSITYIGGSLSHNFYIWFNSFVATIYYESFYIDNGL